ncbi:MAG TPA: hypothetical protein VGV18_01715 [Verrucomicrobiae bacterium]|nr:hypothetical protein [Verrucomicrobiae bacterium]
MTAGVGYAFSEKFEANLAYVHAFANDVSESSAGPAVTLKSALSENSVDFGLTWRF